MNCEKCKIRKATVFYADSGGGRHSLCVTCAAELGKLGSYDPRENHEKKDTVYLPNPILTSLNGKMLELSLYFEGDTDTAGRICPSCATSLESAISDGRVGCPECYDVFKAVLFPSSFEPENAVRSRMPGNRRESASKERTIAELKEKIRVAIENENYEYAAEIRDKIKTLNETK